MRSGPSCGRSIPRTAWTLLIVAAVLLAGCAGGTTGGPDADGLGAASDDGHWLEGIVLDAELLPLSGVTVAADPGERTNTTDSDGRYRLGPLEPGTVTLVAEKAGYKTAQATVDVPAGQDAPQLILEPTSSLVPYHETRIFEAYYDCLLAARYPGGGYPAWPCIGVIDLILGSSVARDKWLFPFEINQNGFHNLVMEMTWEEQATGSHMGVQVRDPPGVGGTDETGANSYAWGSGLPVLRVWAEAGETNPGGDAPFYPERNSTVTYAFAVASAVDESQPAAAEFWISHRASLFATFFHNRDGRSDFTALPDE